MRKLFAFVLVVLALSAPAAAQTTTPAPPSGEAGPKKAFPYTNPGGAPLIDIRKCYPDLPPGGELSAEQLLQILQGKVCPAYQSIMFDAVTLIARLPKRDKSVVQKVVDNLSGNKFRHELVMGEKCGLRREGVADVFDGECDHTSINTGEIYLLKGAVTRSKYDIVTPVGFNIKVLVLDPIEVPDGPYKGQMLTFKFTVQFPHYVSRKDGKPVDTCVNLQGLVQPKSAAVAVDSEPTEALIVPPTVPLPPPAVEVTPTIIPPPVSIPKELPRVPTTTSVTMYKVFLDEKGNPLERVPKDYMKNEFTGTDGLRGVITGTAWIPMPLQDGPERMVEVAVVRFADVPLANRSYMFKVRETKVASGWSAKVREQSVMIPPDGNWRNYQAAWASREFIADGPVLSNQKKKGGCRLKTCVLPIIGGAVAAGVMTSIFLDGPDDELKKQQQKHGGPGQPPPLSIGVLSQGLSGSGSKGFGFGISFGIR